MTTLFHFGLICVLGRSSIWMCRILNFEFRFFVFIFSTAPACRKTTTNIQNSKFDKSKSMSYQEHWYWSLKIAKIWSLKSSFRAIWYFNQLETQINSKLIFFSNLSIYKKVYFLEICLNSDGRSHINKIESPQKFPPAPKLRSH